MRIKMKSQMSDAPKGRSRFLAQVNAHLDHFRTDERGGLIIFGLILLTLMIMMGGLAVDLMRHERTRTELQQTLDRSVLAASSLRQTLPAEGVVRDYFDKAGLSRYLSSVTVDEGLNYRTVTADAAADTEPFFMHMMGIDKFEAAGASIAEQRISNIEISLVLDISGSMSGSRINNLRPAAKEFIDTVIASSEPGLITVSIIPYNSQVNLGAPLMSQFNVTRLHDASSCIELPDSAFNSISVSQTTPFVHNSHFDAMTSSTGASNMTFNCPPQAGNVVTPLNGDANYLKGRIDALITGGYTSIDVGMKWGSLLLDPAAEPVVDGLITAGAVDAQFQGRPKSKSSTDPTMKVVVLMTDGDNTNEYKMKPAYTSGLSPLYRHNTNGRLSAYNDRSGSDDYFWDSDNSWHTSPEGGTSGSTQLAWPEVWAQYSINYITSKLLSPAFGYYSSTWKNEIVTTISSIKDTRLRQVCDAAKAENIIVFGVAFEAPSAGRAALLNCATSPSHYFNASGIEITSTFRAIANQISQLRLTQ